MYFDLLFSGLLTVCIVSNKRTAHHCIADGANVKVDMRKKGKPSYVEVVCDGAKVTVTGVRHKVLVFSEVHKVSTVVATNPGKGPGIEMKFGENCKRIGVATEKDGMMVAFGLFTGKELNYGVGLTVAKTNDHGTERGKDANGDGQLDVPKELSGKVPIALGSCYDLCLEWQNKWRAGQRFVDSAKNDVDTAEGDWLLDYIKVVPETLEKDPEALETVANRVSTIINLVSNNIVAEESTIPEVTPETETVPAHPTHEVKAGVKVKDISGLLSETEYSALDVSHLSFFE